MEGLIITVEKAGIAIDFYEYAAFITPETTINDMQVIMKEFKEFKVKKNGK